MTRACYLLECAHYVHLCNRGHWPSWLKANLPAGRPSRGGVAIQAQALVQRRSIAMQLQAGKMFHQWGEVNMKVVYWSISPPPAECALMWSFPSVFKECWLRVSLAGMHCSNPDCQRLTWPKLDLETLPSIALDCKPCLASWDFHFEFASLYQRARNRSFPSLQDVFRKYAGIARSYWKVFSRFGTGEDVGRQY